MINLKKLTNYSVGGTFFLLLSIGCPLAIGADSNDKQVKDTDGIFQSQNDVEATGVIPGQDNTADQPANADKDAGEEGQIQSVRFTGQDRLELAFNPSERVVLKYFLRTITLENYGFIINQRVRRLAGKILIKLNSENTNPMHELAKFLPKPVAIVLHPTCKGQSSYHLRPGIFRMPEVRIKSVCNEDEIMTDIYHELAHAVFWNLNYNNAAHRQEMIDSGMFAPSHDDGELIRQMTNPMQALSEGFATSVALVYAPTDGPDYQHLRYYEDMERFDNSTYENSWVLKGWEEQESNEWLTTSAFYKYLTFDGIEVPKAQRRLDHLVFLIRECEPLSFGSLLRCMDRRGETDDAKTFEGILRDLDTSWK